MIFTLYDSVLRIMNPLRYARKHGMRVGKGVTLAGRFGSSFGSEPYLIQLDDYVRMSGGCSFFTHDGGTYAFRDIEKYKGVQKYGSIHVGERTFIGYGAIILPGVTIGKRCVIGAGAVVANDIPDNCVAAGVPAKVICSTTEYAEKSLQNHNEIGFDADKIKHNKREYLTSLLMK